MACPNFPAAAWVLLLVGTFSACGGLHMPTDQAEECLSLVLEVRADLRDIAQALTDRRIEADLEWWSYGSRIASPENSLRYAVPYVYGGEYFVAVCGIEDDRVVLFSLGSGDRRGEG